jgi:hypothetical protein
MKGTIAIGFVTLGLALAPDSQAADRMPDTMNEGSNHVGLLAGLSFPSGGSKFTFGATLGHKMSPTWGAGLYLTYWGTSIATSAGEITSSSTVSALEGSYFFPDIVGLRVGGKAGVNFIGGSSTVATDNAFVIGPHIGYDYQISRDLSFGGEFNLLLQTKTGSDALTSLLVALKYWF